MLRYNAVMDKPLSYPLYKTLQTSFTLAYTHFKLRTERSVLGMFWYALEPLMVFGVLLLITQVVAINHPHYSAYLFLGLIIFHFFSSATNHAAHAILQNRELIKWVTLRIEIFPLAHVLQFVISHAVEVLLFAGVLVLSGLSITWLLFYPLIFIPFALFTLGIALCLSVATVFTSDIANAWRILVSRLLWLGTPIFYVLNEGTLLWTLNQYNPLFYFITLARTVLIDHQMPTTHLLGSAVLWGVGVFTLGLIVFIRFQSQLAERI